MGDVWKALGTGSKMCVVFFPFTPPASSGPLSWGGGFARVPCLLHQPVESTGGEKTEA
jgi:hypothetical protein